MNDESAFVTKKHLHDNPFVVESPERLEPQEIVNLFVERYTKLEVIKQRKHTIVWGSRGSGKSMLLRYLEPRCQAIIWGGIDGFLTSTEAFLAVYCPCKEGRFNKTELLLLDEVASSVLTEHLINLNIADRLLTCLREQFPDNFINKTECTSFARRILQLFDPTSISSSIEEVNTLVCFEDDPLGWLCHIFNAEQRSVNTYLRRIALPGGQVNYVGATTGYHDFLLPLLRIVQGMPKLHNIPIYLLLDDADRLSRAQQTIINTWIANRDQSVVCIKVSSQPAGYKTFKARDGGSIEQPHDYSEVDVDELYTRSRSDYAEKIKLIAERRLVLSPLQTKKIDEFLPEDLGELALLEKIKEETKQEWTEVGKPGRQHDYVYRYAIARLFQHLRKAKKRKSYAGFQNMVNLSSGIVRDFLEPCYLMFDALASKVVDRNTIEFIPANLQDEVLFKYSEQFLIFTPEEIRKDLTPYEATQLEQLMALVQSLGQLFYERLTDPTAREAARLFSFTVRGRIPSDIQEVLEMGVRYRYFQLGTYSTKEGGGRENWYILNRRLCPVFKLDPSGFGGRISITPNLIRLAFEDPDKFVRLRLRTEKTKTIGQIELFDLGNGAAQ
jgi:hypothetical protein